MATFGETNAHFTFGITNISSSGKWGTLQKVIRVNTSDGFKPLRVQVTIPTASPQPLGLIGDRTRNLERARADRQAVFKNECARCHAQPAAGKISRALFLVACGICYESAHRVTMVPDLQAVVQTKDRQFWKSWIAHGKPGTLMPAFAISEGGPLTEAQIESLVDYLTINPPQRTALIPSQSPTFPPLPPAPTGAAQ